MVGNYWTAIEKCYFLSKTIQTSKLLASAKKKSKKETIVHLYLSKRNENLLKMKVHNVSYKNNLMTKQIELFTHPTPEKDCMPKFGGVIIFYPQIFYKMLLNKDNGSAFIELIIKG